MPHRHARSLLFLLALARGALATEGAADASSLHPSVSTRLTDLLQSAPAAADFDALYRQCLAQHGRIEPLLDELRARYTADGLPPVPAAAARRVAAQMLWRNGDLRPALEQIDTVLTEDGRDADRLDRALLLDATGQTNDAATAYRELLPGLTDEALATRLRIRLALMALERQDASADERGELARFAREQERDEQLRNRAAVVLGITGRPQDALELFTASDTGSDRFRDLMRNTEWALDAGDIDRAVELAWQAREAATLTRDRRYALTVLVEAYREKKALGALIERFAATAELDEPSRQTWIDLLRETGQIDAALELFHNARGDREFTADMRRQLLEMCRESGRDDTLVDAYHQLIATEPDVLEWREGLARHHKERGDDLAAGAVWQSFLADERFAEYRLEAAAAIAGLGLDDLAIAVAQAQVGGERSARAHLFLFGLYRSRGRLADATAELERLDAEAAPDSSDRMALAEAYEQLGRLDRAVAVLTALREARGAQGAGEDLEMRLAWLLSEVGDEDAAMARWQELWQRVDSVARRRYVEDRLMTVASRIGRLADVAVALEDRLLGGNADEKDAGLLVRLYSKANDPVSAAEVIEDYMARSGSTAVSILKEKARVYLSCNDYHNFEEVMHQLIEVDPDDRVDHLRQLAMSSLERGRPEEARGVLAQLREIEGGEIGAEFEAGVLALSGLREEAADAYRMGLANHVDRIEIHLLLANVLKDMGQAARAIGMFQYLAETADGDDLFTIAIDGLLNMEAPAPVLRWARRITYERITRQNDKLYLYQLVADLCEELRDLPGQLAAQEAALPIAGERRGALLRELMELARNGAGASQFAIRDSRAPKDDKRHLAYGRRLIGLREVVPPQVYLDLGDAFLHNDEVTNAAKTFQLASDVPDYVAFQRQIAQSFEEARYFEEALRTYERLLIGEPSGVALLVKVAELHEQLGHDTIAGRLYLRAMELLFAGRPLTDVKQQGDASADDPWASMWQARNLDDFDRYQDRVTRGLLITLPGDATLDHLLTDMHQQILADVAAGRAELTANAITLERLPRARDRANLHRRIALAFDRQAAADACDLALLAALPDDDALLRSLVKERMDYGRVASARQLIDGSGRSEAARQQVRYLTGSGALSSADAGLLPLNEITRLLLPLLCEGRNEEMVELMQRGDHAAATADSLDAFSLLFSSATLIGRQDLILTLGRQWINAEVRHGEAGRKLAQIENIFQRCARALEPALLKSLTQSLVSTVVADRNQDQDGELLDLLPRLQRRFAEPLLPPDELVALLEKQFAHAIWGAAPVFEMLPRERRTSVLRSVWPKIAKTERAFFLLNLAGELTETVDADLADLLVESLPEAVEDAENKDSLHYYASSLGGTTANRDLARRMLEVLRRRTDHPSLRFHIACLLGKSGQVDDGLLEATGALADFLGGAAAEEDWQTEQAIEEVYRTFLPAGRDALLQTIDAVEAKAGPSPALARRRIALLRAAGDDAATLAAIDRAVAAHPDDDGLLQLQEAALTGAGRRADAVRVLERRLALTEDPGEKQRLRDRLVRGYEVLRDPEHALAVMTADDVAPETHEAGSDGGDESAQKTPRATIHVLKQQLEAGEFDRARLTLHRLWRGESPVDGARAAMFFVGGTRYFGTTGYLPEEWPAERDDESNEPTWSRDGLPDRAIKAPDAAAEATPDNTFRVLLRYDFGQDELRRRQRVMGSLELARAQSLFDAMAEDRVARSGKDEAFRATWSRVESGTADRADYSMLLAQLESAPDAVAANARRILLDILATLDPGDGGSLMRIARTFARVGATAEAAALYRWCATQSNLGGRMFFYDNTRVRLSADQLVAEVKENLPGETRTAVIEQILAWADPGDDPWSREDYETLVLSTWMQMLEPEQALIRCRSICDTAADADPTPRRTTARQAAQLLARCGEIDAAVRCLETAITRGDDPGSGGVVMIRGGMMWTEGAFASSGSDDLLALYPVDMATFKDPLAWLTASADAWIRWNDAQQVTHGTAIEALTLLALRLHATGDVDAARATLERARSWSKDDPSRQLWIADAARRVGSPALADDIERALFDDRRLNPERVPEVIERVLATDGPAAALALGDAIAETSPHPRLLELLIDAAGRLGDADAQARWRARSAQVEAAAQAIELRRAAARDRARSQ